MIFMLGDMRQEVAQRDLLIDGGEWFREHLIRRGGRILVYSDPPWNPGNEKYWRRHAGAQAPTDYRNLLNAWCRAVSAPGVEHIFCEQSFNAKHRGMFTDAVSACPTWDLPLLEEWTVYYGSPGSASCRRPNVLLHFGRSALKTDPTGMHGEAMTRKVFDGLDLDREILVVDPCTGKGMTSRMAHRSGLDFFGTELNAWRLEQTCRWLRKQGYQEQP